MNKLAALSLLFGFWCAASFIAFADEPIWTADQRKKLEMLIADHGHDVGLAPDTTAALGLGKKGEILTLRQLTVNTPPSCTLIFRFQITAAISWDSMTV
jgi:hypothetical protein